MQGATRKEKADERGGKLMRKITPFSFFLTRFFISNRTERFRFQVFVVFVFAPLRFQIFLRGLSAPSLI